MIFYRPANDAFTIDTTLDLSTTTAKEEDIRKVLESQMKLYQVGSVSVPKGEFTFRHIQGNKTEKNKKRNVHG